MLNEEHGTQENEKESFGNHSSNRSSSQSNTYQHCSNTHLQSHLQGPPCSPETMKKLHQEVLDFLWNRQEEGEKIQKRRLIAKDRIPASFNRGGVQVPHPADIAEGLHLNLLQKIQNRIRLPQRFPLSHLPTILEETLRAAGCPTFTQHLEKHGRWDRTAKKIKKQKSPLLPSLPNNGKAPAHPREGPKNMAHSSH